MSDDYLFMPPIDKKREEDDLKNPFDLGAPKDDGRNISSNTGDIKNPFESIKKTQQLSLDDRSDYELYDWFKYNEANPDFAPSDSQIDRFNKVRREKGIRPGKVLDAMSQAPAMLWDELVKRPGNAWFSRVVNRLSESHAKKIGDYAKPNNKVFLKLGLGFDESKRIQNPLSRKRSITGEDFFQMNVPTNNEFISQKRKQIKNAWAWRTNEWFKATSELVPMTLSLQEIEDKNEREEQEKTMNFLHAEKIKQINQRYRENLKEIVPEKYHKQLDSMSDKEIGSLYSGKDVEPPSKILTILKEGIAGGLWRPSELAGTVEGMVFRQGADLGVLGTQLRHYLNDKISPDDIKGQRERYKLHRQLIMDRMAKHQGDSTYIGDILKSARMPDLANWFDKNIDPATAEQASYVGPEVFAGALTKAPIKAASKAAQAPTRSRMLLDAYKTKIQAPLVKAETAVGDLATKTIPSKVMSVAGKGAEFAGSKIVALGEIPEYMAGKATFMLTRSKKLADSIESMMGKGTYGAGLVGLGVGQVQLPLVGGIAVAAGKIKLLGQVLKSSGRTSQSAGKAWSLESQKGFLGRIAFDPEASPALRNFANWASTIDPSLGWASNIGNGVSRGAITGGAMTLQSKDEATIGGGIGIGGILGGGGSFYAFPYSSALRNASGKAADIKWFGEQTEKHGYMTREQYDLLPDELKLYAADSQMILGYHPDHGFKVILTPDKFTFQKAYSDNGGIGVTTDKGVTVIPKNKKGQGGTVIVNASKTDAVTTLLHEVGGHAVTRGQDMGELMTALYAEYGKEGIQSKKDEYALKLLAGEKVLNDPSLNYDDTIKSLGKNQKEVDAWIKQQDLEKPTWWAEEIFASHFAKKALDEGGLLGMSQETRMTIATRKVLLEMGGKMLQRIGINVRPDGSIPDPTSLFEVSQIKDSPALNNMVRKYLAERANLMREIEFTSNLKESRGAKISPERLGDHPAISWEWNNKDGVWENDFATKTDDGVVTLKPNKTVKQTLSERLEASKDIIGEKIVDSNNAYLAPKDDGEGNIVTHGTKLPPAFYDLPQFSRSTKELAKAIERSIDTDTTMHAWYNAIGTSRSPDGWAANVKRGLGNLRTRYREIKPLGFKTTKAGHILTSILDVDAVLAKASKFQSEGRFDELFNGSLEVFHRDLYTYFDNHKNNVDGGTGIGPEKKNFIRAFLDVPGGKNPLAGELPKGASLIKTFRIDRFGETAPSNRRGFFFDYMKIKQNEMPTAPEKGNAQFMPAGKKVTEKQLRSGRQSGAVLNRAIVPQDYVPKYLKEGDRVLDAGAGQHAKFAEEFREQGYEVDAFDLPENMVKGLHQKDWAKRKHNIGYSSRVLNVMDSRKDMSDFVGRVAGSLTRDGKYIVNIPDSPRYGAFKRYEGKPKSAGDRMVKRVLLEHFNNVEEIGTGGHRASSVLLATNPKTSSVKFMPAGEKKAGKDPYSELIYSNEKLPKGVTRDEQANIQYKGKQPKDWTPEEFKEFGEKFDVKNLGPLSEIETIRDGEGGGTLRIPGGLHGKFTFYDLLWIKNNNPEAFPRNDQGGLISEKLHAQITDKLARTMTPEKADNLETFNRMVFGMLSPNAPLLPNEFGYARLKFANLDQVKEIAKISELLPKDPSPKQRKAVSDKVKKVLGVGAKNKGGLGIGITQDFTNVADFARLWIKDPEWFNKAEGEGWGQYVDRVGTQLRGLGTKTASFGGVWQDPAKAMISAIDRHMAKMFADKVIEQPEMRARFENGIVSSFNKNLEKAKSLKKTYDREVKTGVRVGYKKGKKTLKRLWPKGDEDARLEKIAELTEKLEETVRSKGLPDPSLRKAKTLDAVMKMTSDIDSAIVGEWMGQAALDAMGAKQVLYRNKKGEVNPNVRDELRLVEFISEPEKFKVMSDAYREALNINEEKAKEMGVAVFPAQWTLWDRIRGRVEPHEVMFPGYHKLPKMGPDQIRDVMARQTEMGYATAPNPVQSGTTSPASMAYFMPAGKGGDIFYSNTSKALESPKVRKSAPGPAMLNDILKVDNAAGQEMKWMDLDRWLMDKKGKVTKEEVQDFINANQIRVTEKVRGGDESPELEKAILERDELERNMWEADDRGTFSEAREAEAEFEAAAGRVRELAEEFDPKFNNADLVLPGAKKGSYRELELMLPKRKGEPFVESHFEGDENVFAHVRFNERTDADGKRMLFIEEVQSDWAAKGRDFGFEEPFINGDIVGGPTESVPSAPFVSRRKGGKFVEDDKWRALAMKRMIRWAADEGYDRLGWINGRDTADRYNLSKFIDRIEYQRLPGENMTWVTAWDKAGNKIINDRRFGNRELKGAVSKDIADKIIADEPGQGEFTGMDLVVGGEGHKQFYDVDLPNYTGKYVKKWGGKVGEVEFSLRAAEDAEALKGIPERTKTAHYVDITPQMKGDVQQGQAMFMPAGSDAAYMKAAKKGDTKGAQLLVDKAAKAAGYTIGPVYHGTNAKFANFDPDKSGQRSLTASDDMLHFTSNKSRAERYSSDDMSGKNPRRVVSAYLDADSPVKFDIRKQESLRNQGYEVDQRSSVDTFYDDNVDLINEALFDAETLAIEITDGKETHYIVADPSQIKSADPITRDDAGNIIPLSERFQSSSDDIRYMPAGDVTTRYNGAKSKLKTIESEISRLGGWAGWQRGDPRFKLNEQRGDLQIEIDRLEVPYLREITPHYDDIRTSLPDGAAVRDVRPYVIYRGESGPPEITSITQSGGGEYSNVSSSQYPFIEATLSNGGKLLKQVRISDHPQVSVNAPRHYDVDVRLDGNLLNNKGQITKRSQAALRDALDDIVGDVWREQKEILQKKPSADKQLRLERDLKELKRN